MRGNSSLHQTRVAIAMFPNLSIKGFLNLLIIHTFWILGDGLTQTYFVMATECTKRNSSPIEFFNYYGKGVKINRTVGCDMKFQWTVADYCCYNKYDHYSKNPFCCYSETYKIIFALGFVCLLVFASALLIFLCGFYNLPHYTFLLLTCGTFHLNDWLVPNYTSVDMSYLSEEPFWSKRAKVLPYPLRPMPAKIFYPKNTIKFKSHVLGKEAADPPLFVVASRQFTRKPCSARPPDPVPMSRSYLGSIPGCGPGQRGNGSLVPYQNESSNVSTTLFGIHINEHQATEELLEALRILENNDATSGWNPMTQDLQPVIKNPEALTETDGIQAIPGSISYISLGDDVVEERRNSWT